VQNVGTVFRDPRNNYNYEIVEKKINSTLTKAALPYIGTKEPTDVNVPDKFTYKDKLRTTAKQCLDCTNDTFDILFQIIIKLHCFTRL
jgi:hypothetical protein